MMNDAFSSLEADKLLDSLNTNQRLLHSLNSPVSTHSLGSLGSLAPASPALIHAPLPPLPPLHRVLLGPQQRLGQITKARLLQLFSGRK